MRKGGLVCLFLYWLCGLWGATAQTPVVSEREELKRRQVPKEVRRNVRLAYPYHIYRDWAKVDSLYSVRVISVNYETVYFDSTGEWLRAYRPVRPSELPYRTYLFLKGEFGVYRILRAYQVQQSDDLAHYSVEMEHKRIHSLKTYLEFDFVGDLTMLDGKPVGDPEQSEEPEVLSQEAILALYGDVYDPVAEEAAYAADATVAVVEFETEVENGLSVADTLPMVSADTVTFGDTVLLGDTVIPVTPPADTLPMVPIDTAVWADTLPAVVSGDAAVPVDTLVAVTDTAAVVDTTVSVSDTASVLPLDTLPAAPADKVVSTDTAMPADTVQPAAVPADTVVSVTPPAETLPSVDTVVTVMADTLVAEVDTAAVQPAVTPTDTIVPADTVMPIDTVVPVADTVPALAEATVPAADTASVVSTDTLVPEAPLYPEIVGKNFKKRFPNAEKVNWRQADGLYLVTFDQFGQVLSAAFREDGVQIYTAYAFSRKEMPLPIERYLQVSAAKMKMTEGWRVVYESKYKRTFASSERPKDYYYVVMGRKIPKSKKWQYIRYTFNQNAQFESKSDYDVQPSDK